MSENDGEDNNVDVLTNKLARKNENPADNIANWLQQVSHGTLSTISVREEISGFPFGSIVPFALDEEGRPFILIAEMAAHTHNLIGSNNSCLLVSHPNPEGDPQSNWRISVIGKMKRLVSERQRENLSADKFVNSLQISTEYQDQLLSRYVERVPSAENYLTTHHFNFWRFEEISTVRYIAGFGKICWVPSDEVHEAMINHELNEVKQGAIEHMNDDHEDSMITLCEGEYNFKPKAAQMIDMDPGGIMIKTSDPEKIVYKSFPNRICADDMRTEIVTLIQNARAKIV